MHIFDIPHLISMYGYVGIFVVVLIESGIFFFLPGDSLLFTAGFLVSVDHLHIAVLIVIATAAASLGNFAGYWIGVHIEDLRRKRFLHRILKDEYVERARIFFEKRGRMALLLSRFVPGVRTATPWVAGIARMERRTFIKWSIGGAVIWASVMTLLGYFLGQAFPNSGEYLTYIIIIIIFVSVLPAVFEWWRERRQRAGE